MGSAGVSMILFRGSSFDVDDAYRALSDRRLAVRRDGDALVVRRGDGPMLTVGLARGEVVQREATEIGEGTPHAASMSECDARFEISSEDLAEILDEMNTLIEVQLTLQEATRGFLFNTWNGELSAPDE
jgi:hypothetical protein